MSSAHPPRSQAKRPPNQVRIIGGQWKRTPLPVPEVEGLRPTPDRVRETLFNWLGQDLSGWDCLDLFAGTGALSFEAASRGAARVVCVEANRTAADAIARSIAKLDAQAIELRRADAAHVAQTSLDAGARFDLIFLDPPFHAGWPERLLPIATQLLTATGTIYLEAEAALAAPAAAALGLTIRRQHHAGQVHYHLLARIDHKDN